MDQANVLIVGGGVIGCAIALALSRRWDDVFLAEQLPKVGMATSTRNSGVIHSGIYYPQNSLKAGHCIEGNRLMYEFCAAHEVPHRHTGKLVVAANAQEAAELAALLVNGRANGVEGLQLIDGPAIRSREPHIAGYAALDVPSTGIVSSEELVKAFARIAAEQGASIVTRAKVEALAPHNDSIRATMRVGDGPDAAVETIEARCVINAAGLYADEVAALIGNHTYKIYPVRGEYCEVRGPRADLVRGLVYPLPHRHGLSLGVHLTRTLWNTLLVGPTARYVTQKNDYERDRLPIADFARSAQKLLPDIREEDMQLAYSGLRPKLARPDKPGFCDFVITRDPVVSRAIHLVGMESPGLTGALSIAKDVFQLVSETL